MIDAEGAILGRLATEVATLLRGKHKPIWAPHVDTGDHVIVVNASKLAISPRKATRQDVPPAHRLPGRHAQREPRAPARPRSREGRAARGEAHAARRARSAASMLKKLRVHAGPTHPHQAQQPVERPLPDRAHARVAG